MNNTIKYQNYLHFKIPITNNISEYGELIEHFENKYIVQLNNNVLVINQIDDKNFIKFFRKGELMFEFKDLKKSERSFIRILKNKKYTFENDRLISTEILSVTSYILIYKYINSNLTKPCYNTI